MHMHAVNLKSQGHQFGAYPTKLLELLHMDVCGKIRIQILGKASLSLLFIYNYSKYDWTLFPKNEIKTLKYMSN